MALFSGPQTLPLTSTYSLHYLCHIISYFCVVSLSSDNMSNAVCDMYCVAPCSFLPLLVFLCPVFRVILGTGLAIQELLIDLLTATGLAIT